MDELPYGGTCALRGCDPKKVAVGAAELADCVGLTESEAREEELDLRVNIQDTSDWYSNRRVAETCATLKVVVDDKADRVVGAHLLGPHADEVINLFALAIRSGVPATDLRHLLYAYPTSGSDVPYMM